MMLTMLNDLNDVERDNNLHEDIHLRELPSCLIMTIILKILSFGWTPHFMGLTYEVDAGLGSKLHPVERLHRYVFLTDPS